MQTRLLIGGPARCGKTTLAQRIAQDNPGCFAPGVDILLRAMLRNRLSNRLMPVRDAVAHYLTRPRFQDAERRVTENVMDYSAADMDTLLAAIPESERDPVRAYGRVLDEMAATDGKDSWAVFDVHSELAFHRLQKAIPGLHLVCVFRDPREAIAAAIYWRRGTEAFDHTRREFRHFAVLWALAAAVTLKFQQTCPDRVSSVTFTQLLNSKSGLSVAGLQVQADADSALTPGSADFAYRDGAFMCPDGQRSALLSRRELGEIAALLDPLARQLGIPSPTDTAVPAGAGIPTRAFFALLTGAARINPGLGVVALELFESPLGFARRALSGLRTTLRAVQGGAPVQTVDQR